MALPSGCVAIKAYLSEDYVLGELPPSLPMRYVPSCPCDDTELQTVATLVGRNGAQQMRIGCCPSCGYIGYIDRVPKEWLIHYNSEIWDNPDRVDIGEAVQRRQQGFTWKDERKGEIALALLKTTTADRQKPVCEIGTGYGSTLKVLADAGFVTAIGMEASRHRARVAREAYGLEVLHGAFEDPVVQARLRDRMPIGLFYSHHVLEHTYDLKEILSLTTALQSDGDYLISILPNFTREPTSVTLFFLGHQHLLNPFAFEKLLNRYGYEITDDSLSTHRELNIVAKKAAFPLERYRREAVDYVARAVEKFAGALKLSRRPSRRERGLWGSLYHAINRERQFYRNGTIAALHRWFELNIRQRPLGTFGVVIGRGKRRFTSPEASPLEFQFDGNIRILY